MVLGACIFIIILSSPHLIKLFQQNIFIMLICVIPSFFRTIIPMTGRNTILSTKVALLISYYILLGFWGAQALGMSLLTRNVSG